MMSDVLEEVMSKMRLRAIASRDPVLLHAIDAAIEEIGRKFRGHVEAVFTVPNENAAIAESELVQLIADYEKQHAKAKLDYERRIRDLAHDFEDDMNRTLQKYNALVQTAPAQTVATWHDRSGNGHDLTPPDAPARPVAADDESEE